MKYKGIELKEVTKPQLFDPPKKMFVWDHCRVIRWCENPTPPEEG